MPCCIPTSWAELFRRRWPLFAAMMLTMAGAVVVLGEPDNTAAPAAGGSSLTIEQIGDALDSYGKNTTMVNGHTEYHLNVHKGKKNINVTVSLSPSGKVIWMTSSLAPVPEAGKVVPAALIAILKKNTEIGPMFFSIANGSLSISNPVANQDESAGAVGAQVEALISTVLDTEDLWKPQTLSPEPAIVPAPDGQNSPGK